MTRASAIDRWVTIPKRNPAARLRLMCFPYGGAGASIFRAWPAKLPPHVELCAIQMPGRETRVGEVPIADMDELLEELVHAVAPLCTMPFAFFGHSLGAFIAFELAHLMRANDITPHGPVKLIASGQRAPHMLDRSLPLYHLPDNEFVEALQIRYSAIPDEVIANPELLKMLLPMLRADFTLHDTYRCAEGTPLDCPIAVFGGDEDPETNLEELAGWERHTSDGFQVRVFSGGHFFIRSASSAVLSALAEELTMAVPESSTCR